MSTASSSHASEEIRDKTDATLQELSELMVNKDQGLLPWRSPLHMGIGHNNLLTKHIYTKTNAMVAGMVAASNGYDSKGWMTFAGGRSLNVFVSKGAKAAPIRIFSPRPGEGDGNGDAAKQHPAYELKTKDASRDGSDAGKKPPGGFYRQGYIFNSKQFNWGDVKVPTFDRPVPAHLDPMGAVREAIGPRMPSVVIGAEEGYDPMKDVIIMKPSHEYRTTAHEAWSLATSAAFASAHEDRMDRRVPTATTADVAREQIRAESAATILLGHLGFENYGQGDRVNSIHNWGTLIKDREVVVGAEVRNGGRIATYLLGEQRAARSELAA